MGLVVITPGLFTTVQDLGRPGFRAFGVPPAGCFDRGSAGLANALLGNPPGAAVLEFTLNGGVFEADGPTALGLAGAPLSARVLTRDGRESHVSIPIALTLSRGDRLIVGGGTVGARAYLATRGGWATAMSLGSRSTETPLRAGETLPCADGSTPRRRPDPSIDPFRTADSAPLRVVAGPDFACLEADALDCDGAYRVGAHCDRMGLRLEGPELVVVGSSERLSTPVVPGAFQVAGGQPLLLGVACGTMGGYPHVAQVVSADLDRVGQARPGNWVRFVRISVAEARALDRAARADLDANLKRVVSSVSDPL